MGIINLGFIFFLKTYLELRRKGVGNKRKLFFKLGSILVERNRDTL